MTFFLQFLMVEFGAGCLLALVLYVSSLFVHQQDRHDQQVPSGLVSG